MITLYYYCGTISFHSPADVGGQFTTAPPTCPNETFTFRCTVAGDSDGVTIWRVGGIHELHLLHSSTVDNEARGLGGVFTARFDATNTTSFSSTLSGTATPALDGILVECFGPTLSRNIIGNSTLQILGQCVQIKQVLLKAFHHDFTRIMRDNSC